MSRIIRPIRKRQPVMPLDEDGLTPLERASKIKKEMRDSGVEMKIRNPREQWEDSKLSLRKSINAKCYDCCGEENHRARIKYCNIFDCSLWLVRPYSTNITKDQCLAYEEKELR